MKMIYFLAGFLSVVNFATCLQAQTTKFSEAKAVPADVSSYYDYERWKFSIGENNFELDRDGKGRRLWKTMREFQISLDQDEYIDRVVYFADYKKDILLLGEVNQFDAGGGFLIRIDGKTLAPKWHLTVPAFNIAKGLIENDAAYLAGIGYAAKIDLATGKEIWKHDNFYRKYRESGAFNIFEVPEIDGETIVYVEKNTNRKPPNIIVFNKMNGDVIEVEVNE